MSPYFAKPLPPRKPAKVKKLHPRKPTKPAKPGVTKRSDPTPDPMEIVEYTGNLETDAAAELTAMQKAYRERAKNEEKRMFAATDSEYWCCVCFRDRAERERFMKAIHRDKDTKYVTGDQLAAALGITF